MDKTINLGLPYIAPGQAQKHVTHNEAIRALDAVIHISVVDRDLSVPPSGPSEGDRYLVAASASGDWMGHDGWLAAYQDGAWQVYQPRQGWLVWVEDESALLVRDGDRWTQVEGGAVFPSSVLQWAINTDADANNRLSVKSDGVLFSHDDVTPGTGDVRVVINKSEASRSASVLFQDNWSGRAEVGLTGSDSLIIRVSGDGNIFFDVMELSRVRIDCRYPVRLPLYQAASLPGASAAGQGAIVMARYTSASRAPVPAYSDGQTWRSLIDNDVIV